MFNLLRVFKNSSKSTVSTPRPTAVAQTLEPIIVQADKADCFDGYPRRGAPIDRITCHEPAVATIEGTIKSLHASGLSVHFCIDRDGTITQHCPVERQTAHAGIPRQKTGHNSNSIGLEFINRYYGHRWNQVKNLPLYSGQYNAGILRGIWVDRAYSSSTKTFLNPDREYIMMPLVQLEAGWQLINKLMKDHPLSNFFDGITKNLKGQDVYNWQAISGHDSPGVKCHSFWGHADGRVPAYFSFLRSYGFTPDNAYAQTIADATSMQRQTLVPPKPILF